MSTVETPIDDAEVVESDETPTAEDTPVVAATRPEPETVDSLPAVVTDAQALAVQPNASAGIVKYEREQIDLIKRTIAPDATDDELELFVTQCERTGLDPFARQIYWTKYRGKVTIMTSIDGLRLIAERTGQYQGRVSTEWCGSDGVWKDVWLEDSYPAACRVAVMRAGNATPTVAVALWKEFAALNKDTWKSMPTHMLAKVAESHALRASFPNEMGGLYTSDEMDQADKQARAERNRNTSDSRFKKAPPKMAVEALELFDKLPEERQEACKGWWAGFADADGNNLGYTVDMDCLSKVHPQALEQLLAALRKALPNEVDTSTTLIPREKQEKAPAAANRATLYEECAERLRRLPEGEREQFDSWCHAQGIAPFSKRLGRDDLWAIAEHLRGDSEPFEVDDPAKPTEEADEADSDS